MQIILLNGPPGCGKDYAGAILEEGIERSTQMKLATEVKNMTHRAYGLGDIEADHYEDHKDVGISDFRGVSPRSAYIQMSECFMKPLHGDRIFGHILKAQILFHSTRFSTVIVTDSGFRKEAEVLVAEFGALDVLLVRIHLDGYDFASDSRSYLDLSDLGVQCLDIQNDGGPGFRSSLQTVFPPSRAS
tara:strand:+ start:674 stop:1237 length:564 start_codon:yes stop_codon:yes gene_type:complete